MTVQVKQLHIKIIFTITFNSNTFVDMYCKVTNYFLFESILCKYFICEKKEETTKNIFLKTFFKSLSNSCLVFALSSDVPETASNLSA